MSYDSRRDNRTAAEFERDIRVGHLKEKIWANILVADYKSKTGKDVTYTDTGVDNNGDVIIENSTGRDFSVPDFCFDFGDHKRTKEIKTAPEYLKKYYTFKTCSIKKAVELQSDVVLCRLEYYDTFDPTACQWMLDNLKSRIYRNLSPNDLSIRISQLIADRDCYKNVSPFYDPSDESKLLTLDDLIHRSIVERTKWGQEAQKLIEENREVLLS